MCYCCRKLENSSFCDKFERPWEAVRGCEGLIGSDRSGTLWHRSLSQWEPHGLSRPLTASQICHKMMNFLTESPKFGLSSTRPHNICHVTCLSQSVEHGLSRTRPLRSLPIGLSRTPGDAVILGPAWLISRLNALLRPVEVRLRVRSERPIGLSRTPIGLWGKQCV